MRVAAALLLCACSLARLPDASFPCSVDSDCLSGRCVAGTCRGALPDAGFTDAGTPDSGAADGGAPDAGLRDGGAPDAGDAGPGSRSDGGELFCDTWSCAAADAFTAWDGGLDFESKYCAETAGGLGTKQWFGAVLAPTGNVVGIPALARRPLRVNSKSMDCELFGKELAADAGYWMSGVLGRDGLIYAAPNTAQQILRIHEGPDGGELLELWGPPLAVDAGGLLRLPHFVGSTLDRDGNIWMVSASGHGVARVSADGSSVEWFSLPVPPWNLWGITRVDVGSHELLVSPPSIGYGGVTVVDPLRPGLVYDAAASLPRLYGAQLRLDGTLVTSGEGLGVGAHLQVFSDAGVSVALLDAGSLWFGFAATGPDGEVWAMPRNDGQVVRMLPSGPVGYDAGAFPGVSGYSSCGVVATPHGLIGLPCDANDSVLRLNLSSGERRTMRQLMSPFFNKL